jgi:hypothetical protein
MSIGQVKKDRKAGPRRGERKVEEKNNLKGDRGRKWQKGERMARENGRGRIG